MDLVIVAIVGLATAFNFMIIKWKAEHERYLDLTIDIAVLASVSWLFSGSAVGIAIAMIASCVTSIFLLIYPPKFDFDSDYDYAPSS